MTDALEAEVRRLEQERAAATLSADTAALKSLLDDELVLAYATGGVDTRPSLLAKLSSGELAFSTYDFEPTHVDADGTVGIVTGRLRATLDASGRTVFVDSTVTDVWLRCQGELRLLAVLSHSVAAADAPDRTDRR